MIELNGEDSGGQVLRTALALSVLTKKPFKLHNIRKKRNNPGLQTQHLTAIETLKNITDAYVEGMEKGSQELLFYPRTFSLPRTWTITIPTAGSLTLLLQAILPLCIFHEKKTKLILEGGTDVPFSMPYDYFAHVFLPALHSFADIQVKLLKRGYYPKGQGKMEVTVQPKEKKRYERTTLPSMTSVGGVAHASADLEGVAERIAQAVQFHCKQANIQAKYDVTASPGAGVVLWAVTEDPTIRIGASCLGEKGVKAEDVGKQAVKELNKELLFPVDKHLADNLLVYLGIVGGKITTSTITNHSMQNIKIIEAFLPVQFSLEGTTITAELTESPSSTPSTHT